MCFRGSQPGYSPGVEVLRQQGQVGESLTSNRVAHANERFVPVRKWIVQYLAIWLLLCSVFSVVQHLKGRELSYALEFGVLWALISSTIFFMVRIRNYRSRVACQLCNDLPDR